MKRICIAFIMLLALAACSIETAAPTQPAKATKPPTLSPAEAVNSSDLEAGTFKAVIGGSVLHVFDGKGLYVKMEDGSLFLTLTNSRDVKNATISIILPSGTQPGQFNLQPYSTSIEGETTVIAPSAGVGLIVASGSKGASDMFVESTTGTLNIESLEPISGSFQFTAHDDAGREVTVSGSFNQIPLSE